MNKVKLKQFFGLAFLNNPLSAWFEPATRFLIPLAYVFKYARWYRDHSIKEIVLPTERSFGHHNRYQLYEHLATGKSLGNSKITYLEFGVASGCAIEWWLNRNNHPESRFYGFDTFEGLPEDWGDLPSGTFSTQGKPPDVDDDRCQFEVGLFQDTLPGFLQSFQASPDGRTVVHIDCDLYSASLFVLTNLGLKLRPGDILIFDEFADVMHEFRAYLDFTVATGIKTSVIGAANGGHKMVFLVNDQ